MFRQAHFHFVLLRLILLTLMLANDAMRSLKGGNGPAPMEQRFESFDHAQGELDRFVDRYNSQRPHQGIDMAIPRQRFLIPAPTVSSARSSVKHQAERKCQASGGVLQAHSTHFPISAI